ncbi:MAG: lasso peptide biosynthesis B2 protein [Candidatus Scalindua sp.]|nr:lasso peptide biosynthesis B2 protein [Candidatus Scalindua sp.]
MRKNFKTVEDIWIFIQILFFITTLPLVLRFFSLPGLMRVFTPRTLKINKSSDSEEFQDKVVRFTDYVLSLKYFTGKNPCLKRSLVLYHLLRKSGMEVSLCLGVRFNRMLPAGSPQKRLEGHAWLLYKGRIFLEKNSEAVKSYKITYIFPEEERNSVDNL